jgi:hypothetical protein
MNTFYLICFVLGFVLSLLAAFSGLGRLHFGHTHTGRLHSHHQGSLSVLNGFTLPAFLCCFGGAGYLLHNYSSLITLVALLLASLIGFLASSLVYVVLFKFLLPRERILSEEDTCMDGVVARVSGAIRPNGGTGEILFTQLETRRSAAARSETGVPIPRGTEVVVLRYTRGIAYVTPLEHHLS